MKIIQVITAVSTIYGGPALGSVALNRGLRDAGVDATIVTSRVNGRSAQLNDQQLKQIAGTGTSILAFPASFPRRLQNSWLLAWYLFRHAHTADIVHMHGQYSGPHVAAYLAAKLTGTRWGLQPHGGLEPYQRAHSKLKKRLYDIVVGKRIRRGATYVLFASDSEARNAGDLIRRDQVLVASLGASLESPTVIPKVQTWLGTTPRRNVVLFLGRLAKKKRPDLLLEQWASERLGPVFGARLIIAGPDDDYSQASLRESAERLGIGGDVLFVGNVTGGDKAWLYSRAGTFVLPSENENFAIAVAEAMLAGCSVLTTRAVAAGEHVSASGGGTVVDSPEDVGTALRSQLSSDRCEAEGSRARAYAQAHLGWSSLAKSLTDRIDACLISGVDA